MVIQTAELCMNMGFKLRVISSLLQIFINIVFSLNIISLLMPASWEDESVVHANDAVLSQLNHA